MRTIINEYDNHHNVLCHLAGCRDKATWDVSNAVGERLRSCDDHLGDTAANIAHRNREEA